MEEYRVKKVNEIKQTSITVHVPGSKSITNRALLLAALAKGESALSGVLFSDGLCAKAWNRNKGRRG